MRAFRKGKAGGQKTEDRGQRADFGFRNADFGMRKGGTGGQRISNVKYLPSEVLHEGRYNKKCRIRKVWS